MTYLSLDQNMDIQNSNINSLLLKIPEGLHFNGKIVLAMDDELDVLEVLEEEILEVTLNCHFFKANTYKKGSEFLCRN
jgi:hypothetical protein